MFLIKESGLFVFEAELAVDGGEDALYLSEGEHTAQEGLTGIMAVGRLVEDATRLVGKSHTMIDTHGQLRILFLEDTAELDEVCATAKVRGFREVAVGEDMTAAQMDEVGA